LNFVALVTALDAVATGRVGDADPSRYETLPENESRNFTIAVRGARIVTGTGVPPFTADLGLVATRRVRVDEGKRALQMHIVVEDIGDLRTTGALETIEASGLTVAPVFDESLKVGQTVDIPDRFTHTIEIGAPAAVAILRPAGSRYTVERVIKGADPSPRP
jgi:hypothetical protein